MNVGDIGDGQQITVDFIIGRRKKKVTITRDGDKLWLKFGFNKKLIKEIKECFEGRRWNPDKKMWYVNHSPHNWFQIHYLMGQNPYDPYDVPLKEYEVPPREIDGKIIKPYNHQVEMTRHVLTRKQCVIAGEMGTGKTLALIIAIEILREKHGDMHVLWVAPRSALNSVKLEFKKWRSTVEPEYCTYSSLKKLVSEWDPGRPAPRIVVYDESSRLKNPTAQRTQAAKHIADSIRFEYGDDGYIVLMSGTPAPKSPVDWYSQCEIAQPGFLKEGHPVAFKKRLAVIQQKESAAGGVYPELITWLDEEGKCSICGQKKEHENHTDVAKMLDDGSFHNYEKADNEIDKLYRRMDGLVLVKFKRDCVDLPEKQFRRIYCKPKRSTLRTAALISRTASSTIKALTLLRQLSDGFKYREEDIGEDTCEACQGKQWVEAPVYTGPEKTWSFLKEIGVIPEWINTDEEDPNDIIIDPSQFPEYYKYDKDVCPNCNGVGKVLKFKRTAEQIYSPKEDALKDLVDQHDDVGRIVVYAGFMGSVDRCCCIAEDMGWDYMRVDGRGWSASIGGNATGMLETFQDPGRDVKKMAFIGQPGAAGMGLTLTESPSVVYYSNDFNAESRIQSMDRIHRLGMDTNRGATIYDLIHLPTDEYVLENLNKKRRLQNISLGELQEAINEHCGED